MPGDHVADMIRAGAAEALIGRIRAIVAECPIEIRDWPNTNGRKYPCNTKSEAELVEWIEKLKEAVK